ncbi:cytochrome P450 [Mycobacterium deserti]|uniref:Cytochrome P450 n=1 Tax=Mycobacterium deserti TaxID=2978347 RepID=A0ABT2MAG9_9MYCO|nr:cytochrome P450 [Mycobacterium deserti]MCT7659256.1 cytochrome P450 [Mycobacterium deserti]
MDTAGIPHPPHRVPILGDVTGIDPRAPVTSLVRRVRDLGPISVQKVLSTEIVIVNGADLVAELNDETRFAKHAGPIMYSLREIMGDSLFTVLNEDPNWQLAHDILAPGFTRDAMAGYHHIMVGVARDLLARWDTMAERQQPVDVTTDMTRLTLETIARAGFGYGFGSFDSDRTHPFIAALARTARYANLSAGPRSIVMRRLMAGSARQHRADIATVERTVDDILQARLDGTAAEAPDLLGRMLSSTHAESGRRLDRVNIRQQIVSFIVAGRETTSGALSFALYYLTRDADCLARAQAEVDAVWGDSDDIEPSFTDVARLRYLRAVVDEALRLWPTAPAYLREARAETVLGGKYRMKGGDWAMILLPLLHRDPRVWPDPDRFDPGRFLAGQAKHRPAFAYRPFGTGPRACIGRQFGLHEAVLALGLVLHRYELRADDGYRLRIAESFTLKPRGFTVTPRRRR